MTRDPDLAQSIEDLRWTVKRLRVLESQMGTLNDPRNYNKLAAVLGERADVIGELRVRAEKLNMPWRALLLVVEEYWRLVARHRRKPDERVLEGAVRTAGEIAERERIESAAELVAAQYRANLNAARVTAATAALAYMEASHAPA